MKAVVAAGILLLVVAGTVAVRQQPQPGSVAYPAESDGGAGSFPLPSPVTTSDRVDGETLTSAVVVPVGDEHGISRQRVFRLILENGQCHLEAVEEVSGDFRRSRGRPDMCAGMIACRLVGAGGDVLAEELVNPPDAFCAVLDPNVDGDGERVALLAGTGPQVFQVRFPMAGGAEKLEVHRINSTRPGIEETLLLTVSIQR